MNLCILLPIIESERERRERDESSSERGERETRAGLREIGERAPYGLNERKYYVTN